MPAAPINTQAQVWMCHPNPYVRLIERDATASAALAQAAQGSDGSFRLLPLPTAANNADDYTQIDPALPLARDDAALADPLPHTSYAGMNPAQRRRFANWLAAPEMAAPVAFRRLYLAWLEIALFEEERRAGATAELFSLLAARGWRGESSLAQSALLAAWLAQLGEPLSAACALALAQGWNLRTSALENFDAQNDAGLLQLRISSLTSTLGAEPLAWALAHSYPSPKGTDETTDGKTDAQDARPGAVWLPWHTIHRSLRLLLPQFDLRAALEPRLAELFAGLPVAAAQPPPKAVAAGAADGTATPPSEWTLILEFGNSRSQHYEYVTHLARKQTGYQLLMDETRQLIHRIRFRKRNLRQFWRLWAYVESWSSTHVYVNGEEVQKWNVFPYSADLR